MEENDRKMKMKKNVKGNKGEGGCKKAGDKKKKKQVNN